VLMAVRQLESGRAETENQYSRALDRGGNRAAQELMARVFEAGDRSWRGIGNIPSSGYRLCSEFQDHDAERLFDVTGIRTSEPAICISGDILKGDNKPHDCPAFGLECTPLHPLGATMVSAEGACHAYFVYGRLKQDETRPARGKGNPL